jgi:chorismate mutase
VVALKIWLRHISAIGDLYLADLIAIVLRYSINIGTIRNHFACEHRHAWCGAWILVSAAMPTHVPLIWLAQYRKIVMPVDCDPLKGGACIISDPLVLFNSINELKNPMVSGIADGIKCITQASWVDIGVRMEKQATPPGPSSAPLVSRGVRGATTVTENTKEAILEATREMMVIIIRANDMRPEDVASAYFTTTVDLNATYPALAARQLGWYDAALLCGHEMDVPGGLKRCIRVLIHWNTHLKSEDIIHVYLRDAKNLRPDRQTLPEISENKLAAIIDNFDMNSLYFDPDGLKKR